MTEDLKQLTRRTWEEILPSGDADALAAVVDPGPAGSETSASSGSETSDNAARTGSNQ